MAKCPEAVRQSRFGCRGRLVAVSAAGSHCERGAAGAVEARPGFEIASGDDNCSGNGLGAAGARSREVR